MSYGDAVNFWLWNVVSYLWLKLLRCGLWLGICLLIDWLSRSYLTAITLILILILPLTLIYILPIGWSLIATQTWWLIMELALLPISGWELPIKTEAVRPFKYLLRNFPCDSWMNSAIDPQPIPSAIVTLYLQLKGQRNGDFLRLGSLTVIWLVCPGLSAYFKFLT